MFKVEVYAFLRDADNDGVPRFVLDMAATALKAELVDELDI